jgi:hypothetical protein
MTDTNEQTPVFLPRSSHWTIGVDLGQSIDPTAICAIEHIRGVLDPGSELDRHCGLTTHLQKPAEKLFVRYLKRLPLGTDYNDVVQAVIEIMARPPLTPANSTLVIDESGPGRAVGDIFVKQGLRPKRVTITAGSEATGGHSLDRYYVAKSLLISKVDAMFTTGELQVAEALREGPALRDELQDFRRKLSDAGRATYAARTGAHDDIILCIAVAVWWTTRPQWTGPLFTNYGHVPKAK